MDLKPYYKEKKKIIIMLNMNLNTGELFKKMMNMNLKIRITLESRRNISTTGRSPPRLMFLASQT